MSSIYVREQGTTVRKHGEKLLVTKEETVLLEVPLLNIDNVAVFGKVQVTTQALHAFLERGISVSYFTYYGKYLGHIEGEQSKNIFLRLKQYELYEDKTECLEVAKKIVSGKIDNQIGVLQGHRWNVETYNCKQDIKQMKKLQKSLQEKKSIEELMGIEGICSKLYFGAYAYMIKGDGIFDGRNRQPPKDPVNAMLSLGYSFLEKEICSILNAEGMDCYIGILHGIRYGRKSLALDLMEEFRQPVIDRLVMRLWNKRILSASDFVTSEEDGVVLSEDGFKRFCQEYESWISGENISSGECSFRKRMNEQGILLKKSIMQEAEYQPYCWEERYVHSQL